MNITFKTWIKLVETLSPDVKNALLQSKWPANAEEIEKAVKELEDDSKNHDKKSAFTIMQSKFVKKKNIAPVDVSDQRLLPYKEKLENKQLTIPEYKTAEYLIKNYSDSNGFNQLFEDAMTSLRNLISNRHIELIFKTKPQIKFGDNVFDNYQDLTQFLSLIHNIEGQIGGGKIESEEGLQNPAFLELQNQGDLVSKGDKIWVFKGDDPFKCRLMGKGQRWCISSSTSVQYYFNYRHTHGQTQYFIFDFNKAPNDPARYVNPGVAPEGKYSEWVDRKNTHSEDKDGVAFGVNGYSSLKEYLEYLKSKGVDITKFVADPLTEEEKKLADIVQNYDLPSVKKLCTKKEEKPLGGFFKSFDQLLNKQEDEIDGICKILFYYLKLKDNIPSRQFKELLNDEEKELFVTNGKQISNEEEVLFLLNNPKILKDLMQSRYVPEQNYTPYTFIENLFAVTKKPDVLEKLIKFVFENKTKTTSADMGVIIGLKPEVIDLLSDEELKNINKFGYLKIEAYSKLDEQSKKSFDKIYERIGSNMPENGAMNFIRKDIQNWISGDKLNYILTFDEKNIEDLIRNAAIRGVYYKFLKEIASKYPKINDDIVAAFFEYHPEQPYINGFDWESPTDWYKEMYSMLGVENIKKLSQFNLNHLAGMQRDDLNMFIAEYLAEHLKHLDFFSLVLNAKSHRKRSQIIHMLAEKGLIKPDEISPILKIYNYIPGDSFFDKLIGWETMSKMPKKDYWQYAHPFGYSTLRAISHEFWNTLPTDYITYIINGFLSRSQDQESFVDLLKIIGKNAIKKINIAKIQEENSTIIWLGAVLKRFINQEDFVF